ncbi:PDZ domain-containing protein, partial [Oleiphilus sp. HI0080]
GLEGGVQVVKVQAGPASNAGIRQGDIIAKINNESFESLEDFEDIVDDLPEDKAIPVLVIRGGNPSFLVLKIEE